MIKAVIKIVKAAIVWYDDNLVIAFVAGCIFSMAYFLFLLWIFSMLGIMDMFAK